MKVLAFTPTYELPNGKPAMRPETAAAVSSQVFDGVMDWVVGTDNPWPFPTHRNVLHQYQVARQKALDEDYDALWTIEHDMWPPADALNRLSYTPAQVVYGIYVLRHGNWVLNAWEYVNDRNLGESLSLHPDSLAKARESKSARVSGVGWGCTLIHRPALERIEFTDGNGENPAGDLAFATACLRANIPAVARFDVMCGHYEKGLWLWPFQGVDVMMKVEALKNVVIPGSRQLEKGQVYEIEAELVEDLALAGYIRVTSEEGEPETAAMEGAPETAVKPRGRKNRGL